MTTIDSLANETLFHIMEMLKGPILQDRLRSWDECTSMPGRYDALQAAALVCARWRDPAQRALFKEVVIWDEYHPLRGGRFLTSPAELRQHTRSLRHVTEQDARTTIWLEVAEACSALQALDIRAGSLGWKDLARPCLAGLKSLRIGAYNIVEDPHDPGVHLPARLSSLAVWTNFNDPRTLPLLVAIASSSLETLTKLKFRIPSLHLGTDLSHALRMVGPHLRTLSLDTTSEVLHGEIDNLATLKSLESFTWNSISWGIPLLGFDLKDFESILDALPSPATLRHLSIGTSDITVLKYIKPLLLGHPALDQLVCLDFPLLSERTPLSPFAVAFLRTCESRQVRVSLGPSS